MVRKRSWPAVSHYSYQLCPLAAARSRIPRQPPPGPSSPINSMRLVLPQTSRWVRTICSLTRLPSISMVLILLPRSACPIDRGPIGYDGTYKSIPDKSAFLICMRYHYAAYSNVRAAEQRDVPMVVMNEGVHESSQKRKRRHDFPTPCR